MARLVMWNIITVDGYFEGSGKWELPWHEMLSSEDLEEFSAEQLERAGALLLGRVTYEGLYSYWRTQTGIVAGYMNSLKKYVAGRKPVNVGWNNTSLVSHDLEAFVGELKRTISGDILLFGSSLLSHTLMKAHLIDEYRIGIAPHFHGRGRHLFERGIPETDLRLTTVRRIRGDGIVLSYENVNQGGREDLDGRQGT